MPVMLDVFFGPGSVGKAFLAISWEVFSVDIDPAARATLKAHIHVVQLSRMPPSLDCIWASPPHKHYYRARSHAQTPRDLVGSNSFAREAFELVVRFGHPDFSIKNAAL